MSEQTIIVPGILTPENVLNFSKRVYDLPLTDVYIFDLAYVGHVEPFGMLYLSATLRQFMKARRAIHDHRPTFQAINYKNNSYASFMGFYKSFGLDHGNEPGEAPGSTRYLPMTRLRVRALENQAQEEYVPVGEIIEAETSRISGILTQRREGDLLETLTYSLREIFRNVVEHSQSNHIWYAAQYWPTRHKVELAVLDEGVGISRSLARNPIHQIGCDEHALYLALQPGISGVRAARGRFADNVWRNTGYGLFMTSSLCKNGGDFIICSNTRGIHSNSQTSEIIESNFDGTALRMVIDTSRVESLDRSLDTLRRNGEAIARESNLGANLSASMISRMLARPPQGAA